MAAATNIILVTGGITFVNEWYQTKKLNWRVPVATLLLAAVFDGLAKLDSKAATGVAIMALIGAMTVEFNGKSAAATVADLYPHKGKK
jgi:hypothetical protein